MNTNIVKIALAAAAVVVLAFIGIGVLKDNTGGPPTATATPVPTPTATPQPLSNGPLEAGIVVATGLGPSQSISATLTVPEGWTAFGSSCLLPVSDAPDATGICFLQVETGLYSDPCHGSSGPADVPVGPTVDEFVNALAEQTAYEATAPTDVTLGGYSGKRMDLQLPSDVASCDNGAFTPWSGSIHAQGPDNQWQVWVLDVEGERMIIMSQNFASTSSEDLAEQQAIVDSIRIQP